jgi:hypothetical protein
MDAEKQGWQDIETAPKDGTAIWARRVYEGSIIKEGWARWGVNAAGAPMRKSAPGGLYGVIPPDNDYADKPRWRTEDMMYSFPTPTEWRPTRDQ